MSNGSQPVEVQGVLVEVIERNDDFEQSLAAAVARGRAVGIPEYGMNMRARMRGRIVPLPVEMSGFTRGFEVDNVAAIDVCPLHPESLEGCSN